MEEYVHLSLETYNKLMEDNKVLKAFSQNTEYYDKNGKKIKSFFIEEYERKEKVVEIDISELSKIFDIDRIVYYRKISFSLYEQDDSIPRCCKEKAELYWCLEDKDNFVKYYCPRSFYTRNQIVL